MWLCFAVGHNTELHIRMLERMKIISFGIYYCSSFGYHRNVFQLFRNGLEWPAGIWLLDRTGARQPEAIGECSVFGGGKMGRNEQQTNEPANLINTTDRDADLVVD